MITVLEAVVGSTAHGLATDASDVDVAGVFVRPTVEFSLIGYQQKSDTVHKVSPEKDITYHEIGKFLGMLAKGSPTILDLVYADQFSIRDNKYIGEALYERNLVNMLSHDAVFSAYTGMIKSNIYQAGDEEADTERFRKQIRHAVRLSRQAVSYLYHGDYRVKVDDPERYTALYNMPMDDALNNAKNEYNTLLKAEKSKCLYRYLDYIPPEESIEFANSILTRVRSLA